MGVVVSVKTRQSYTFATRYRIIDAACNLSAIFSQFFTKPDLVIFPYPDSR